VIPESLEEMEHLDLLERRGQLETPAQSDRQDLVVVPDLVERGGSRDLLGITDMTEHKEQVELQVWKGGGVQATKTKFHL
jgi:hypothetical protein